MSSKCPGSASLCPGECSDGREKKHLPLEGVHPPAVARAPAHPLSSFLVLELATSGWRMRVVVP